MLDGDVPPPMNARLPSLYTEKGLYDYFIAFLFLVMIAVSALYVLTGKVAL